CRDIQLRGLVFVRLIDVVAGGKRVLAAKTVVDFRYAIVLAYGLNGIAVEIAQPVCGRARVAAVITCRHKRKVRPKAAGRGGTEKDLLYSRDCQIPRCKGGYRCGE